MAPIKIVYLQLADRDLDFLIEAAASGVADKPHLKQILRKDADYCLITRRHSLFA